MCIGPGEQAGEREGVGVGDQMVLPAELAPVTGLGPGEVKAPGGAKLGKQTLVQYLEQTCLLQLPEAPPTGHT